MRMENNKKKFIFTNNPDTAQSLKEKGFKQVKAHNGEYIFLNSLNEFKFENYKDIAFTNKLNF